MNCPRCGNAMTFKIKDYLCGTGCEKIKNTARLSREEHDYMLSTRESWFKHSNRVVEYQDFSLKTAAERYWDKLWNGK
jgi:hypothetical protein